MNPDNLPPPQNLHLAGLLEAIQRCVYFLDASDQSIPWPLTGAAPTARNLAAHDYQTDYAVVAEHFNTLHGLKSGLYRTANRFVEYCETQLSVEPISRDFSEEFAQITRAD